MLTTVQKAEILRKSGCPLPAAGDTPQVWGNTIEALFVDYVAARAAKSLREAEELRQLDLLRRMSSRSTSRFAAPSRFA